MWDAIHKETGKRFYSGDVWTPGLFDDPHKEEWITPQENIINWDELNIKEIQLSIVKGHFRKDYLVRSFFRIINCNNAKTTLESDEHRRKKTLLSLLLTHDAPIFLVYDTERYPLSVLPIDREKIRNNFKTIEVIRKINNHSYKKADVLIPFIYSNYWGNGLAIEVRETEGNNTKEEKERFWFTRGYSVLWADKRDFIEGGYGIKNNKLDVIPYSIGQFILRNNFEKKINNAAKEVQEKYNEIKEMISEIERFPRFIEAEYDQYNNWWAAKKNYLTKTIEEFIDKVETLTGKNEDGEMGLKAWM